MTLSTSLLKKTIKHLEPIFCLRHTSQFEIATRKRFSRPEVFDSLERMGHRFLFFILVILALATLIPLRANAQAVCVQTRNAQLRKGPGPNFAVSWTVGQLMPFMKIGEQGAWSEVKDLDGQVHWVTSKSLTQRFACAVVKTKQARLHSAPNPRDPASETKFVDRYTPFKKIDRDGAWIQVEDDHKTEHWISETNLWAPIAKSSVSF